MTKARFDIYINSEQLGIVLAAEMVILEKQGVPEKVGVRYSTAYLSLAGSFPIDPIALPLKTQEFVFDCRGGIPAFVDDYLPDAWGRQVLTHVAYYRDKKKFNANSAIDTLHLIGSSRIGALSIVPEGHPPVYEYGSEISSLANIEATAHGLDTALPEGDGLNELGLLFLGNHGSGIGGARPKALLHDGHKRYLGKFNRSRDPYNNTRVELACLLMAQAAGIHIENGRLLPGINNREVLLLNRFDLSPNGYRHHLITVNGLLKEPASQRDHGGVFRYDDIRHLIERFSVDIKTDSEQLLRLMLFNRAIHNTDDHERNFSFIYSDAGYRLSPAYDLVPSLTPGEYHAAGFGYQPNPPRPSEAYKQGQLLKMPRPVVARAADEIIATVEQWPSFAEQAGVSEQDTVQVGRVIQL
ncbi:MAG TPA: type II toxin-antitoxin system HipA family toxin [Cellvibrionaceae bacterium]